MSAGICHHPTQEMLLSYGAGSLDEASALLVASHLSLCADCRAIVDRVEVIGGGLLEALPPAALTPGALSVVMDRLEETSPVLPSAPRQSRASTAFPSALRHYIPNGIDRLPWKRVGRGIEQVTLVENGPVRARLQRVAAGITMPAHTHDGSEMTLVLQGGFLDGGVDYGPGDVATADGSVNHTPSADKVDGCLCLAVTTAPLRLTGRFTRLLNPFLDL